MQIKYLAAAAAAALAAGAALAQVSVTPVSAVNAGTDLVRVIPLGVPTANSVYATIALLRGVSTTNGLPGTPISLLGFKNVDGTTLAATASTGKFGLVVTLATSEILANEATTSSTKTGTVLWETVLPSTYIAGSTVSVVVNSQYTIGGGTIGTHTIQVFCYPNTSAGLQSADISTAATQSVPSAAGTQTFALTSTALVPNERLTCKAVMAIQDTGGSSITSQINSVTMS